MQGIKLSSCLSFRGWSLLIYGNSGHYFSGKCQFAFIVYKFISLQMIGDLKSRLAGFLFPEKCISCGREGEVICKYCFKNQKTAPSQCFCGEPTPDGLFCFEHRSRFLGILSIFDYNSDIKQILFEGKYELKVSYLKFLSKILRRFIHLKIQSFGFSVEDIVLVPVPIHKNRQKQRGFNQSEVILLECRKDFKVSNLLTRVKDTPQQVRLSRDERFENLKGAFETDESVLGRVGLKEKIIFLVDDVFTTGATLTFASEKILEKINPSCVVGVSILREV